MAQIDSSTIADDQEAAGPWWLQPRAILGLWILYGIVFIAGIGNPAVRRTQEARVLESAREMLGNPLHQWIIPQLNGEIRVQKPPLPNWLAAACFSIFGVNEWAGRLPGAIAGWLTVAVTFAIGQRLWNRSAAFFAAASLAGSFLFVRYMQLAETDGLATLFVTAAVYCMIRAFDPPRTRWVMWCHLSAIAMGLAAMSKGPPAAYPLLFLVGIALVQRDWRLLLRWIYCGAPLMFLLIAAPWWAYVKMSPAGHIIAEELDTVASGADHGKSFLSYLPQLFIDTAPWCAVMPAALIAAVVSIGRDKRLQLAALWAASIFVPLCFVGNKQVHYLLPFMPPLMAIVGWAIDRALSDDDGKRASHAVRQTLFISILITALAAASFISVPKFMIHQIRTIDIAIAMIACVAVIILGWVRRHGVAATTTTFAIIWALGLPLLATFWLPTLNNSDTRDIARTLQKDFGHGPYCFYGDTPYLPLCFTMRQQIPGVMTKDELHALHQNSRGLIVLSRAPAIGTSDDPASLSPEFVKQFSLGVKEQHFDVYRAAEDTH